MIARSVKNRLYFLLFFVTIVVTNPLKSALAESYVATSDVVKEIERTLLFDKGAQQELNVYKPKETKRKNNLVINHGVDSTDKDYSNSDIQIIVADPKATNSDVREKEKLAYNAVLIGQYEVAIELYKQVIKSEPENLYAKFSLGVVYQKLGQNRQAKTIYYELLKSDAENKEEVVGNLLAILVDESPKDAIYLLSRLTAENPKSSYILAQAAIAYDKEKNYNQAIDLLKRAVICDPNRVDYKYNLAVIYDKTGDYDNAFSLYSEVIKKSNGADQSIPLDQIRKRVEFIRNKQ